MIELEHPRLSVRRRCELITLSWGGWYRQSRYIAETQDNLQLMSSTDIFYTMCLFYGSGKMTAMHRQEGLCVKYKRAQRLIHYSMGIASIVSKAEIRQWFLWCCAYHYLLHGGVVILSADQVRSEDVARIRPAQGFAYLKAIYPTLWICISARMRSKTHATLLKSTPIGDWQYTSSDSTVLFKTHNIKVSMGCKDRTRTLDGVFAERLWCSVIYEDV